MDEVRCRKWQTGGHYEAYFDDDGVRGGAGRLCGGTRLHVPVRREDAGGRYNGQVCIASMWRRHFLGLRSGFGRIAVDQPGLGLRELVSRSVSDLVHALRADRLVEASHLPFEERLAISVRRRISAEDVPPVGDELSAD